ncbi:hypothetical protein J5N97_012933 [Dioscorea zingiberensis]|uniref:Aminotransferase class I/classII large domain-containing protein n=1 Tax=Dioscorea zingiberensis TaxID=325984 RepID=A0A9D5CR99_9LILI|nr:hypothetical protein J5N97_012933 [Dioscorea zingiberensis]
MATNGAKLSKVACSKTHGEESPYFAGWKAYEEDPYDPINNPSGVIQMGLAENQVSFELLEEYLANHPETCNLRENALFQDYHGLKSFREAMASFMEIIRGRRVKFDPERIVLTAGATAANEILTFILADHGDALLVPTPYYPGFDRDLRWRTGVNIIPVHCDSSNGFQITVEALEAAYNAAKMRIRGVVITNPSNPVGKVIERSVLEELLDFATRKNIHLISDEIYSGSVFSPAEFVSIAEIVEARGCEEELERVHIVYSLSKDLGLPGFRTGTIYSYNNEVVDTARRMSSFSLVSSQTQKMLSSMLSDVGFVERYITTNRERVRIRYEIMIRGLKNAGIECMGGNAGLFCWVDLGGLMEERTREGELRVWELMMKEVKLNITPGCSCHCSEFGWFRVCFANMSLETLEVALLRMKNFVGKRMITRLKD